MADLGTHPLVDVDWLLVHQHDPRVRLVDVRWYLSGKRGRDEYARGHIPGAVFADLDEDLSAPRGQGPGRHPLPTAAAFAATLSRLGAAVDSIVVAYDDAGGAIAARLWWLLRWFGHDGGRVLDGGIAAWTVRDLALTTDVPEVSPAPLLSLQPARAPLTDKVGVAALRRDPRAVVLDARARDRYEGKSEPVDARPGHVPGALSAPFADNLEAGKMKDRAALVELYGAVGALEAERVVCYCGSGVTACHDILALTIAGRDDAILYEGSWSDWAADPDLIAAVGPEPG